MKRVEGFFQSFDMFAAPATLRARGSSSITRTSAGVISFVVFCYFAYIFIAGLYKIFTYESITYSPTFEKIPINKIYAQNFMFGIGNPELDPQFIDTQFSIKVSLRSTKSGVIQNITMQPCKPAQWSQLGQNYEQEFYQHYLDRFLCPTQPQKLKLINSTIIGDATYFQIIIQPIDSIFFQRHANKWREFQDFNTNKFNLFFLDQAIVPNSEEPIIYFVNINHFAYVTPFKEHRTLIRLSNTKISTDYSVIPIYESMSQQTGRFIADAVLTDISTDQGTQNSKIIFQLTNDMFIYNRAVGGIYEMFSDAGGLFAFIIWIMAFFIASFNQYRYVLMVAQTTFNYDKDGYKFEENDFNFWLYIKYSIYLSLKAYFCYEPNWKICKEIQETLSQANNQMDVMRLFRKLQFFEMALIHTTNQHENMLIALTEPRSLQQVRVQRLVLEYYFAVIQGEPAATVQDARTGDANRFANLKEENFIKLMDKEKKKKKKESLLQELSRQNLVSSSEIKGKLMKYLELDEFPEICQVISNYPVALQQAMNVKLSEELQAIQERVTSYFLKLKPMVKVKIMNKFPLIILHRLCIKSQEMAEKKKRDVMEEELIQEKESKID